MGQVSARDMLDDSMLLTDSSENRLHNRTLEELRFVPGDYLSVAVVLPKNINLGAGPTAGLTIKGSATAVSADANGKWGRAGSIIGTGRGDSGWGGNLAPGPPGGLGRGGAHWRARPGIAPPSGRGVGGDLGGRDDERVPRRDRDRERDPLPPRARRGDSPARTRPPVPERDRDRDRPRPRRSRSRSWSPRRRTSRYD